MRILHRFATKLLIGALIVSAVPVTILGIYGYERISRSLELSAIEIAQHQVAHAVDRWLTVLSGAQTDILFLSRLTSLQKLLESGPDSPTYPQMKEAVQQDFVNFSRAKRIYSQVRYIDQSGHEIVRVDSDGRSPWVVPDRELQMKKDRYYFTETMTLAQDDVYVSALDLNREHGKIERPYEPVLRCVTPVVDAGGSTRGILVTNIMGDCILGPTCEPLRGGDQVSSFVADGQGYYTFHSSPEKAWSSPANLDTGHNLFKDFPELAGKNLQPGPQVFRVAGDMLIVVAGLSTGGSAAARRWVMGQVHETGRILLPVSRFRRIFVILLGVTAAGATALAVLVTRRLTTPVRQLQAGTRRVGAGDLGYRIAVHSGDELGELAESFNVMAARLNDYMTTLRETTEARARTEGELNTAHDIQQMFLPHTFPPFPKLPGLDVFAKSLPAREVGGDFYDFFQLGEDVIALTLGDVSGKGVPAALYMTVTSALLRTFALEGSGPSEMLIRANRFLLDRASRSTFVTAVVCLYHVGSHTLVLANAGHGAPLVVDREGRISTVEGADLPLGVDEKFHPEELRLQLDPGRKLVLYSDGVTDAADAEGARFGLERLSAGLRAWADLSAKDLCERITDAVVEFASGSPQFDDVTVSVLEVLED